MVQVLTGIDDDRLDHRLSGGITFLGRAVLAGPRRSPEPARWIQFPLRLIGLLGVCFGVNAGRERFDARSLPAAAPGSPNVVFIVLDTVRAESLSLYGYSRETSPHLAELASRGVRFDQARTAAAWTLPSHASMFTGRWPYELSTRPDRPLDDTYPTLAGVPPRPRLRDRGICRQHLFLQPLVRARPRVHAL